MCLTGAMYWFSRDAAHTRPQRGSCGSGQLEGGKLEQVGAGLTARKAEVVQHGCLSACAGLQQNPFAELTAWLESDQTMHCVLLCLCTGLGRRTRLHQGSTATAATPSATAPAGPALAATSGATLAAAGPPPAQPAACPEPPLLLLQQPAASQGPAPLSLAAPVVQPMLVRQVMVLQVQNQQQRGTFLRALWRALLAAHAAPDGGHPGMALQCPLLLGMAAKQQKQTDF